MATTRHLLYLGFISFATWSACLISCFFHEHYLRTGASRTGFGQELSYPPAICAGILLVIIYATRRSWGLTGVWNRITCLSVGIAVLCIVPMLLGQVL